MAVPLLSRNKWLTRGMFTKVGGGGQTVEQTVTVGDAQGEAVGKQEIAAPEIRTGRHRRLPKHLQDFIVDL